MGDQDVTDVSDGEAVVAGVDPPTEAEVAEAQARTEDETQAVIDAHVGEMSIHGNG